MDLAYFRVSIDDIEQSAPGDGFVDNTLTREYGNTANTLDLAVEKARANIRWQAIVSQLSTNISPKIIEITTTGEDVDTIPSNIAFTVVYDREDYLRTENESSPGNFLTGVAAIKRFIARALTEDYIQNVTVYDPTDVSGVVRGETIMTVTAGAAAADIAAAEAVITVTAISGT